MHLKPFLILFPVTVLCIISCSSPSSSICPPMGNIVSIENPTNPLQINDLKGNAMPIFDWKQVDFQTLEESAQSASFDQFLNKPVLIVFHKTMNCPGCKHQLPFIQASYEKWKEEGLVILTIYRGDKAKDVKSYIQNNNITFMALADQRDIVATKLGFSIGAPMSVFIDKQGIIQEYRIGPLQNQEEIENLLNGL